MAILRWLGKILLWIFLLIIGYLLVAVLLSLIPVRSEENEDPRAIPIYISDNGVHTDIVIHRDQLPNELRRGLDFFEAYPYWAFGWGDKGFYLDTPTWAELRASVAIRAMFLPSPTAMHVTGHRGVGEAWAIDTISADQLARLTTYIYDSFARTPEGAIQPIEGGSYGDHDLFFEAHGNYNAVYTCNNWVNEGLKRAGLRTALWAPSSWGVMRWRKKINE